MDPYVHVMLLIAVLAAIYLFLIMVARWWQDRKDDS